MRFIDSVKLSNSQKISRDRVLNIIKQCSFVKPDYQTMLCEKSSNDDIILEEIYTYNDVYNTVKFNKKTATYVYKDIKNKKNYMMCFKPDQEISRFRSVKQKLGDVSTSYILQTMTDKDFQRMIHTFYTSTNTVIEAYAKAKQLQVPSDICFFYKGGNLFRILLNDLVTLLDDVTYNALLKRSDADFQLFINPDIDNYQETYDELSLLMTYMLYCMKKTLHIDNFNIYISNPPSLIKDYAKLLTEAGISFSKINILPDATRKDFLIAPTVIDNNETMVMYKEVSFLIDNIVNLGESPYFISRNTAIKIKRKDDTYNSFDLLRVKYNIYIDVDGTVLSVPSEVIDVGIPKRDDNTIPALTKHANKLLVKYKFNNNGLRFDFWAPSLNYMIKDINEILFKQNEYPWHDKKVTKRIQRYLLSLLMHYIVSSVNDDIFEAIMEYRNELKLLEKLLVCINDEQQCEISGHESMAGIFYGKYMLIMKKLNKIKNITERVDEIRQFKEFNVDVIKVIKQLSRAATNLLSSPKLSLLRTLKNKITVLHETNLIGGHQNKLG